MMSRQILSAWSGSFNSRYLSARANALGIDADDIVFRSKTLLLLAKQFTEEFHDGIVVKVCDALFEWDDGVIGDLDSLRTYDRAALRYVAVADVVKVLEVRPAVLGIKGMHLEIRTVDEQ